MKTFILGLGIFLSLSGFGANLLEYEYGNQITASRIAVDSDGVIYRQEKSGGGKPFVNLPTLLLTPETQANLYAAIDAMEVSKHNTVAGNPTALGSSSGRLTVLTRRGVTVVVRKIERGGGFGTKDKVTFATSKEARLWLEQFTYSLVKNVMYTLP